jgi:hypothetical protein
MLTLQTAFNKIWRESLKKRKSSDRISTCRNFGPGGARCFVGVLIPRRLQAKAGERDLEVVIHLLRTHGVLSTAVTYENLRRLRYIHDGIPTRGWSAALRRFARENNLTLPVARHK